MISEGIYKDLTSEDYHGDKESYSRSGLMEFQRSAFHYWAKYLNPNRPKKEPTRQMILGSAFHTFILEPHLFADQFAVEPEKVLLKDVGREVYDAYKLQCQLLEVTSRTVLTFEEMQTLIHMQDSLFSNQRARDLLRDGIIEQSFFWKDKQSGLMLKSRPDILHRNMYVDLKTCSDASERAYQKEMVLYGYHLQGAMVKDAIFHFEERELSNVINICVETKYPHTVAIYMIDEEAIDHARKQYKSTLLDLRTCIDSDSWPSYETKIVGLPAWAL